MDKFVPRRGTPNPSWVHLLYMQDAALLALQASNADYLALAPSFFISGCAITQSSFGSATNITISSGFVMFQGELVPVTGGAILKPSTQFAFLKIVDAPVDVVPVLNVDGQTDYVMRQRTAVLTTAAVYPDAYMSISAPTKADLDVQRFRGRMVPKGGIVPYFGTMDLFSVTGLGLTATAMQGWAVCNGNNGTVDMRGLVPLGATSVPSSGADDVADVVVGASSPGDIVGADQIVIAADNLPAHKHSYTDDNRDVSITGGGVASGTGYVLNTLSPTKMTGDNETTNSGLDVKQASRSLVFIQSIV